MCCDGDPLDGRFTETIQCDTKKARVCKSGSKSEADKVMKRLDGFDAAKSLVFQKLQQFYSTGVTHKELNSIATIICLYTGLKLDRLAMRDNRVLVKWFSDNWDQVQSYLPLIHLRDENCQVISMSRECFDHLNKN